MHDRIRQLILALGGFTNAWFRVLIVLWIVSFILLPLGFFLAGVIGWTGLIPWMAAAPVVLILAMWVWQPATLLAFFAPKGVGVQARGSVAFSIVVAVLLALIAGFIPWSAKGAGHLVPWFIIFAVGYTATFVAPASLFMTRARKVFFIALVATMAAPCYYAGWFKSGEGAVAKMKGAITGNGYSLTIDGRDNLIVVSTEGDGKNNLIITAKDDDDTQFNYDLRVTVMKVGSECFGTYVGTDVSDKNHNFVSRILPTPCVSVGDFTAESRAESPSWWRASQREPGTIAIASN